MKKKHTGLVALCSSAGVFLTGCGSSPYEPSELHITKESVAAAAPKYASDVPRLVRRTSKLPSLEYEKTPQTFDVVVHNVSVRDLLFALARDLELDVDIDIRVSGVVSLSAFDQTYESILDRIAKQVPIRYEYVGDAILVKMDEPYMKQYIVEYLDVERNFTSDSAIVGVSPAGGETGGTGGASISNASELNFWSQLEDVLSEIVDDTYEENSPTEHLPDDDDGLISAAENEPSIDDGGEPYFVVDSSSGIVLVFAPQFIQERVETYLDTLQEISRRQVLLEATIVEVVLNNAYNQGIDWSVFDAGASEGLFAAQGGVLGPITSEGAFISGFPGNVLQNSVRSYGPAGGDSISFGSALRVGDLEVALSLLQSFGEAKVVSSPRISAMNNQGAVMRVVDNEVFFEVESEITDGSETEAPTVGATITDTIVPAGFSMSVLPQISANGRIMLNLRPSVTRITGEKQAPLLDNVAAAGSFPTTSVREFESLLTLNDGEVGVLGGFIEDRTVDSRVGLPGAMDIPGIGSFFEDNNEETKRTQLVIFIKATVIDNPSVNGDYAAYRDLLPDTNFTRRGKDNILFRPNQKEVE